MEHVTGGRLRNVKWRIDETDRIFSRDRATPIVVFIQVAELDTKDRGLDLIQPAVGPHGVADIAGDPAVLAKSADAIRHVQIIRRHKPTVTDGAEILRRIETE